MSRVWRHVKTGNPYLVVGRAELQSSAGMRIVDEGEGLVVYRGSDGRLWARQEGEFRDGRFTPVSNRDYPFETALGIVAEAVVREVKGLGGGPDPEDALVVGAFELREIVKGVLVDHYADLAAKGGA